MKKYTTIRTEFETMDEAQEYFESEIYTGDRAHLSEDFSDWLQENGVKVAEMSN